MVQLISRNGLSHEQMAPCFVGDQTISYEQFFQRLQRESGLYASTVRVSVGWSALLQMSTAL